MELTTLDEKFVYDLSIIYDAEHRFLEGQQDMWRHASSPLLKTMLETHMQQTELHILHLEQIYELLGIRAERLESDTAIGLVVEAQKAMRLFPVASTLGDCVIVGAAAKVEHYEIASYRGLLVLCDELSYSEISPLLQRNLQQEEDTAAKLEYQLPVLAAETAPAADPEQMMHSYQTLNE
jgi:ferritin-like metal-binding protein YciE